MGSRPRRYTATGGFGSTFGFEDDDDDDDDDDAHVQDASVGSEENLDIDFTITESGRTVAHLITNVKDQGEDMDFSLTDSGGSVEVTVPKDVPQKSSVSSHIDCIQGVMTRARSTSRAIQTSAASKATLTTPNVDQPLAGSHDSSGSGFVSGLMRSNCSQGILSHTPPMSSSYETRHFGKRQRAGSVSGRLRSASDLEDKGIINRSEKGVLKDLIISGDEALQDALAKYEKGDKTQLESMIKSGLLSQKLPADLDLMGELDLDFLTVDDATIGSMGNQNVESHHGLTSAHAKGGVISFLSSGNSTAGNSHLNEGIDEFDFANDLGGDSDSFLRFNSRSNSIDLDGYRLRSNSMRSESIDGWERSSTITFPDFRSRSNSLAIPENRNRSNSLNFGILQHEPSSTETSSVSHQRWMDRPVTGLDEDNDGEHQSQNTIVPLSGIGASLAEFNNRLSLKLSKAQLAEEKRKERQLKKDQREREKQELKERKEQERRGKKEQKEKEKSEKKLKKIQKAQTKEEEPSDPQDRIVESGTGRPRSFSDPNLSMKIDSDGLLEVERPDGWVGAYSPDSRKIRIDRFMAKRNHRVWTKSVKYDVRKNFADSRLRVKGRFVKKEDELLMRELMSLT